jgi:hypothetical protein
MAKFTPAEVTSLQAGGNERGREIYLKEYDMARNPLPDSRHFTHPSLLCKCAKSVLKA